MTPHGQIIADSGTVISVPNSGRPAAHVNPMQMQQQGMMGPGGILPLHAMQNMRPNIAAETGMAQAHLAAGPSKKKRAPQGDKKKRAKVRRNILLF